jgi:hypothetical protein
MVVPLLAGPAIALEDRTATLTGGGRMSAGAEDTELWQAESLRVVVLRAGDEGDVVTVVVDGKLDRSGAECLRSCVMEALGRRPAMLAVDAIDLTSVDWPGMAGLLRVRHAVIRRGVRAQRCFTRPSGRGRGRWLRDAAA